MAAPPSLSLVVPIYNEEALLPELRRRVDAALQGVEGPYEVITVNDGSADGTLELLRRFHGEDPRWKVLDLARNFGHAGACTAGLQAAAGAAVIFMDADLQDPPEVIPRLLEKWKEGFQVVYGHRVRRGGGALRQWVTAAFYRLMEIFSETPLPLDAGIFSLLDRRAADQLKALPERHRYLPGLRAWVGFSQAAVRYERPEREGSAPKQTWARLFSLAADALFSFSIIPLRIATIMGAGLAAASFLLGLDILYEKLFTTKPIIGWTSVMLTLLTIGGMILLTLGIIGEYIGRIYNELKRRPLYIVREAIGFDP